jgi:hypothetical protein
MKRSELKQIIQEVIEESKTVIKKLPKGVKIIRTSDNRGDTEYSLSATIDGKKRLIDVIKNSKTGKFRWGGQISNVPSTILDEIESYIDSL